MLEIDNINAYYGDSHILHGVSLSVGEGEIVCLLGRNGAGKTTTILMIEHDMKVVFSVADRVTVLYYGKVLATGTPGEIQANDRVREVYLGMTR